ncbi:MAG: dethiobiotin synthase [Gammaproteobacteria bacterium]|nr:MAG: dethiobiotin synthase [Gammaproteobacteria bacterium]
MVKGLFIAGTDTGVGKTYVTCALLRQLGRDGVSVAGMKPVAAGCQIINGEPVNDDVLALLQASTIKPDQAFISPYRLAQACSPHLAAQAENVKIDPARIRTDFEKLAEIADFVIVEGTGGWMSPISDSETMQDIAIVLGLPVVLVVAIRLGCLNHSLLTVQSIKAAGLQMAGWVANYPDEGLPRDLPVENTLNERLDSPFLGVVVHQESAEQSQKLDVYGIRKF